MSNGKASPLGIVRCRDLVELLYGVPMVTSVTAAWFGVGSVAGVTQILLQDSRRIRYELVFLNSGLLPDDCIFNHNGDFTATAYQEVYLSAGSVFIIERDFRSDLDAVTLPLFVLGPGSNIAIGVRETFLTPAPVDEIPLP